MYEEKSMKLDLLSSRLQRVERKHSELNSQLSQCQFDQNRLQLNDDAEKATKLLDCVVSLEQMKHNLHENILFKTNEILKRQLKTSRYRKTWIII